MSLQRILPTAKNIVQVQEEHWIPLSDLMTGLMMMFMLVAIIFMVRIESDAKARESDTKAREAAAIAAQKQAKVVGQIAQIYDDTRERIYRDLYAEFKNDLPIWRAVLSRQDLALRFVAPEVQFDIGKDSVKPEFERILAEFFPRYVKIIASERYQNEIEEIRIEGHTSSKWGDPSKLLIPVAPKADGNRITSPVNQTTHPGMTDQTNMRNVGPSNPGLLMPLTPKLSIPVTPDQAYILNMGLSQSRAFNVLKFVLSNPDPVVVRQKDWLKLHLTANGMSSSKLILGTNGKEDEVASQRVEFKIRTNADKRIGDIVNAAPK
jgi:outer membrane protein OmpA-like peptidoglycan-associated protein